MGHNDILQVRPMKNGVRSLASRMSQTSLTQIVRQRPVLPIMEHTLLRQSLLPHASLQTAKVVVVTGHKKVQKDFHPSPWASQSASTWEDGICSSGGSFMDINSTEATSTRTEVE